MKKKILDWLVQKFALPIIRKTAAPDPCIEHYKREGGGMQEVIDLLSLFSLQGHSGVSAAITVRGFTRAANLLPFSPLLFSDNEWTELGNGEYQNKRDSSVFREQDGRITDISAITWIEKSGVRVDMSKEPSEAFIPEPIASRGYGFSGGHVLMWDIPSRTFRGLRSTAEIVGKEFMGRNRCYVPVIEIYDSKDVGNDFYCYFTTSRCIPQDFYKDYRLIEHCPEVEEISVCEKYLNRLIEEVER